MSLILVCIPHIHVFYVLFIIYVKFSENCPLSSHVTGVSPMIITNNAIVSLQQQTLNIIQFEQYRSYWEPCLVCALLTHLIIDLMKQMEH